MNKKRLFVFSLAGLLAFGGASFLAKENESNVVAEGENVVFETENNASSWSTSSGITLSNNSSQFHKGSYSIKAETSTAVSSSSFTSTASYNLTAGYYDLSFWYKSVSCTPAQRITLDLINTSANNARVYGKSVVLNSSSSLDAWKKVNTRIQISAGTYKAQLSLTGGYGTVYVDDVECRPTSPDEMIKLTHFSLDSDGIYNGFKYVDGKYQYKLTQFDEFDSFNVTSSTNGTIAFYDLNNTKVGGIDTPKSELRFQMPSATYALYSSSTLPSSFQMRRIGYNEMANPNYISLNQGYASMQDQVAHSAGTAYYVSKDNCVSKRSAPYYGNFYYGYNQNLAFLSGVTYEISYWFKIVNPSSDFVLSNLFYLSSQAGIIAYQNENPGCSWAAAATSSGVLQSKDFQLSTIDGVNADRATASYADGSWHKAVLNYKPSEHMYGQYYFRCTVGSADWYIDDFSIKNKSLLSSLDYVATNVDLNRNSGYRFTPLSTETTSSVQNGTLYVNNKKTSPIIYLEPTENDYHRGDVDYKMAESNLDLYSTYYGRLDRMWNEDGSIDYEDFDKSIYRLLNGGPNARVMVHFAMFAPSWWLNNNPDDVVKIYKDGSLQTAKGNGFDQAGVSYSSTKFTTEASAVLVSIIAHMKAQPYYNSVFAFKISAGRTFEWMTFGMGSDQGTGLGDYSTVATTGFRSYLQNKYSTIAALNGAWGTSYSSFSEITPPDASSRLGYGGMFYKEQKYVDFNLYFNDAAADMFTSFAKVVKQQTSSNKIVGGYFGYVWICEVYNAIGTAHTSLQKVLKSPYIDFIASPVNYGDRYLGQFTSFMSANDSARAYGKLYILEQDNRTCERQSYGLNESEDITNALGCAFTADETIKYLKADFAADFVSGAGMWYYDMSGHWFDNDQIFKLFDQEKTEMDYALNNFDVNYVNDVAVFVDEEQYANFVNANTNGEGAILAYGLQKKALQAIGTGYDVYTLSSLVDGVVPAHKLNILLTTVNMNDAERTAVNTHLKKNGQYILYVGPCGYGNGNSYSVDNISSLTGFTIKTNSNCVPQVTLGSPFNTSTYGHGQNGVESGINTYIYSGYDTSWGTVKATSISNKSGLAIKNNGTYSSIYSSGVGVPTQVLRYIMYLAGVHSYSDDYSNVIYSNSHYVSVHSVTEGSKTITLPSAKRIYDVFAGTYVAYNASTFTTKLESGETKLFRLEDVFNSSLVTSTMASKKTFVSLAYKYNVNAGTYSNSEFRLSVAFDKSIQTLINNEHIEGADFGVEVTDGTKTLDIKKSGLSTSREETINSKDYYVATLSFGDIINNINFFTKEFTFKSFLSYQGTKYYGESKTISLASMVKSYYEDPQTTEAVRGLYNYLRSKGLYSTTYSYGDDIMNGDVDYNWFD